MQSSEKSKSNELKKAAQIIQKGGVIIFPTDTVYGIGCRYDNEIGVARIRRIKGSLQNFPILVRDIKEAHHFAKFTNVATDLSSRYWPGPLTLILQSQKAEQRVALRIPDSNLVKSLIEKSGFAIIGTSANFHGQKTPTTFAQIDKKLLKKADFSIKGICKYKKESTVVDATIDPPKILRRGASLYGFEN